MTTYAITYSERSWVSDPGDESGEPYSYRGTTDLDVTLHNLFVLPNAEARFDLGQYVRCEGEPVTVMQAAFVTVVLYHDGDTFGSSGYWEAEGVYATLEAAQKAKDAIPASNGPWQGYFAHLDEVRIEPMIVVAKTPA